MGLIHRTAAFVNNLPVEKYNAAFITEKPQSAVENLYF